VEGSSLNVFENLTEILNVHPTFSNSKYAADWATRRRHKQEYVFA